MEFSVGKAPSQKEFLLNMEEKQQDSLFTGDMEALLRPPLEYDQEAAFDWLRSEVLVRI